MRLLASSLLLMLSGCSLLQQPNVTVHQSTRDWRQIATTNDRARLHDWRKSFVDALEAARKAGHSAEITREGALLEPDAVVGGGPIPNGAYRCRMIKIGAKPPATRQYAAFPASACAIRASRGRQHFSMAGASQRIDGVIFQDSMTRQVLLGTLVLSDERRAIRYGEDQMRDVAGFVEQVAPRRWRIVLPEPHFESRLDVIELTPAQQGVF